MTNSGSTVSEGDDSEDEASGEDRFPGVRRPGQHERGADQADPEADHRELHRKERTREVDDDPDDRAPGCDRQVRRHWVLDRARLLPSSSRILRGQPAVVCVVVPRSARDGREQIAARAVLGVQVKVARSAGHGNRQHADLVSWVPRSARRHPASVGPERELGRRPTVALLRHPEERHGRRGGCFGAGHDVEPHLPGRGLALTCRGRESGAPPDPGASGSTRRRRCRLGSGSAA